MLDSHVQIDAYSLLSMTTKARNKFKIYCMKVKKYHFSRYICPTIYKKKKFLWFSYTVKETVDLSYEAKLTNAISGSRDCICPMFDNIVEYQEIAQRSMISKLNVTIYIPLDVYKNMLDIAEYQNY